MQHLTIVALLVGSFHAPFKCAAPMNIPGYSTGEPVLIVDGELFEGGLEGFGEIDDIHSIEISCWDPGTGLITDAPGAVPFVLAATKTFAESEENLECHPEAARAILRKLWDEAMGEGKRGEGGGLAPRPVG